MPADNPAYTTMSRITKEIAANVARQMAEHKHKEWREAEDKMKEMLRIRIRSHIPQDVLDLFDKYPEYFKTGDSVRLDGHGFNNAQYYLRDSLPCDNYRHYPEMSIEQGKTFWAQHIEIDKRKKEWEQLRDEIEIALLNLKTYKKVQAMLPEAYPYLPQQGTLAVAVNLDGLRSKLNSK